MDEVVRGRLRSEVPDAPGRTFTIALEEFGELPIALTNDDYHPFVNFRARLQRKRPRRAAYLGASVGGM